MLRQQCCLMSGSFQEVWLPLSKWVLCQSTFLTRLTGSAVPSVKHLRTLSWPATTARWDSRHKKTISATSGSNQELNFRLILTSCWLLRPLTRSWRSFLETSAQAPETTGAQNSLTWSSGRDFPCLLQLGLMVTSQRCPPTTSMF